MGKQGILGPASILMGSNTHSGSVNWPQPRAGAIAVSDFIGNAPSANPASSALPPPPPKSGGKQVASTPVSLTTIRLPEEHRTTLQALAQERDTQRKTDTSSEAWKDLMDRAMLLFKSCGFTTSLTRLVRQAFAPKNANGHKTETILARVIGAY